MPVTHILPCPSSNAVDFAIRLRLASALRFIQFLQKKTTAGRPVINQGSLTVVNSPFI